MPHAEILRYVQARPFTPFRLRLTNGAIYDVTHPELCIVGRNILHLGMPDNPADPLADRVVAIALVHVAELIPLTPGLVA